MLDIKGRILNIQHFCTDDGPGIRTTVFFKGCPLKCTWCHNPETHSAESEIFFREDRCTLCGMCMQVCPQKAHTLTPEGGHVYERSACVKCTRCAEECAFGALETAGSTMAVRDVLADVLTDRVFYETSGGGVTLSGGEPTAQPKFALALLKAFKNEGLHTAIETCAWCKAETLADLAAYTDLFLVDWKLYDEALHKKYTGVSNALIRQNIDLLCKSGKSVILRCPLIPEINTVPAHYESIAQLANAHPAIAEIHLEPYHPMGYGKSLALGKTAAYANESFFEAGDAEHIREYIAKLVSVPVRVN